ncbi:unnamed protein product [Lasius platythorax]|uniref:Uncharacterized protein n=1 Tax=Lasius platythorax TaxID=488582 RepID=A0AAV2P1J4_9HYME
MQNVHIFQDFITFGRVKGGSTDCSTGGSGSGQGGSAQRSETRPVLNLQYRLDEAIPHVTEDACVAM